MAKGGKEYLIWAVLTQPQCTHAVWKCYGQRYSEVLQEKVEGNLGIYENSQDCSVLKLGLKNFLNFRQGQQYTCASQMQTQDFQSVRCIVETEEAYAGWVKPYKGELCMQSISTMEGRGFRKQRHSVTR